MEAEMRKEDRIRQQQRDRREQQMNKEGPTQPNQQERVTGSAAEQPPRPPRKSGKLPLPD
jgi:hypothetical protein